MVTATGTYKYIIPVVAQGHKCVTVNTPGCGFHPHSGKLNIYLHLYFHFFALVSRQSVALSSATKHGMSPEFSGKRETECLRRYSVKLIVIYYNI